MLFVCQIGMSVFGCAAFWCVTQETRKYQKIGTILGLCSNPFWWGMVIVTEQWFTIPLHLVYTYAWWSKAYRLWIKRTPETA